MNRDLRVGRQWRAYVVMGILGTAMPWSMYAWAGHHISASYMAILNATTPWFSAACGAIWLGEKVTVRKLSGLALGVAGVTLLVGLGPIALSADVVLAIALSVLASVCYALSGTYAKKHIVDVPPMALAAGNLVVASFVIMPFLQGPPPAALFVSWRLAGAVLTLAFTAAFGRGVLDVIEVKFESVSTALLVSCLGLFFAPVTMLSCFGPQCVQWIAARGTKPGAASGVIYGISTVGNIAGVMGWQGAQWLERESRAREERPELLLRELALAPGMTVADIGAGTGYYTWQLAKQVGPGGRVYAVDVQPEMIRMLDRQMAKRGVRNVVSVLGSETGVKLPPRSVDLAIMVDVYHELAYPAEVLDSIVDALKPGGRVVFVEYRAEDPAVAIKPLHKMSERQVRREATAHGLKWERSIGSLPIQHAIVFRKP